MSSERSPGAGEAIPIDRNHPVVRAWREQQRVHITCDLCDQPVRGDGRSSDSEWTWIDDGWSLACWECINKAAALTRASVARPEVAEADAVAILADYLCEKVGIAWDDDGGHDSLCESEFIAGAMASTPCDCDHRSALVRAAISRTASSASGATATLDQFLEDAEAQFAALSPLNRARALRICREVSEKYGGRATPEEE